MRALENTDFHNDFYTSQLLVLYWTKIFIQQITITTISLQTPKYVL